MSGDPSMLLGCSLWFYIQQPLSAFSYLICRIRTDALPLRLVLIADWLGSRTVLSLLGLTIKTGANINLIFKIDTRELRL